MFGFIAGVPRQLKHLFSKFKPIFSKPASKEEYDIKSTNKLHRQKRQNTLNRFVTDPKWNIKAVANEAKNMLATHRHEIT